MTKQQLECKNCKCKKELTEEEIVELSSIISKRNLEPDSILNLASVFDGKTCPNGGMHDYRWNKEFFTKMVDDASEVKEAELHIVKNNNESADLENKIKEMTERIEKNKETNINLEQSAKEKADSILRASGKDWKKWLSG